MIVIFLLIFSSVLKAGFGVCYFPVEFQGIFSTQSTLSGGGAHKYSQITILPDAIPVWGICHEMSGSNVILYDSTGGQECYRCFHVTLRSPNVIQVYTEGLDKCYTNDGTARASCPTSNDIRLKISREIMLYKSRSFTRDGNIDRFSCPFDGKYFFTYDVNDGTENSVECLESKSTISNCPKASELQIRFTECKFRDTNLTFRCLGNWKGIDGFQYFALWDTHVSSDEQPQYRCAMYHIDTDTGRVFISFSIDATCTNHLQSPWDGYETMVLTPAKGPSAPAPVHSHSCYFPQWAYGDWKDIRIHGRELIWKDGKRDKVFQTLCLVQSSHRGDRYSLYSLNQCGEEEFTCIWLKSRDRDVMEFKIAAIQYNYFNNNQICSDDVFVGQNWITEGRVRDSHRINCPVVGEHTGVIPDAPELCARLASDCTNPAMMFYEVMSCANSSQVFEKRKYQCLGQWKENGIMYTFTYRLDVNTYECFAGVLINEEEAYIAEAGVDCQRGLQPLETGMKLVKKASCPKTTTNHIKFSSSSPPRPVSPIQVGSLPSWWPSTTRKPWLKKSTTTTSKPLWKNQKPRGIVSSSNKMFYSRSLILAASFYVFLCR